MPAQPPIGGAAAEITTTALDARVAITIDQIYTRLLNETRRLLADFSQQPIPDDQLADKVGAGLHALTDTLITREGRGATGEAFNLGRNESAQAPAVLSQVTKVVRTEILDHNTCPPCEDFDGNVYVMNSPEYFRDMPPNGCNGGEACRGFYMYL